MTNVGIVKQAAFDLQEAQAASFPESFLCSKHFWQRRMRVSNRTSAMRVDLLSSGPEPAAFSHHPSCATFRFYHNHFAEHREIVNLTKELDSRAPANPSHPALTRYSNSKTHTTPSRSPRQTTARKEPVKVGTLHEQKLRKRFNS